jgi:hypothetical protein
MYIIEMLIIEQCRLLINIISIVDPANIGVMKMTDQKTSIQISPATRDRLFKLKFRRTYDQFLNELCDVYEMSQSENK